MNRLKGVPGSFVGEQQRQELQKMVTEGGRTFQKAVESEQRGLSPRKSQELPPPDLNTNLLTDDDVLEGETPADIDINEQGIRDREPEVEESHEIVHPDGSKTCKYCASLIFDPDVIQFSDEELLNYLFGGRIDRRFRIEVGQKGFEFGLITLNQEEIDDCSIRLVRDMERGEILNERDYSNRLCLYQLIHSITDINGQVLAPPPPKNPSQESIKAYFDEKKAKLFSYGHNLVVMMSTKQALLENSIRETVADKVRIKN